MSEIAVWFQPVARGYDGVVEVRDGRLLVDGIPAIDREGPVVPLARISGSRLYVLVPCRAVPVPVPVQMSVDLSQDGFVDIEW